MLQKELAKRLRGRFETEMDGDGWLAVSSDGMPLCRVKYNGNCIVNDNPYLSEEYLGKIAEVQNELLTVKDYMAYFLANTYPLFTLPCGGASCLERTTK